MNPFVAVLDSVDNLLFSPPASPMSASAKRSGPVRVALIGAGLFAQEHARALSKLQAQGKVLVTHVYSRSSDKASALARGILTHEGKPPTLAVSEEADGKDALTKLLEDPKVDAVDVVLPIAAQPAVVVAALQAGKYVLSEKPLAPSVAVATKTIDAAKEANALGRWGVAENYRFEPAVERLASADIGTVRAVRLSVGAPITGENPYAKTAWRQSPEHVGAYFGDAGPHYVAALRAAVGSAPRGVRALATQCSQVVPAPDAVAAVMTFPGDVLGTLHVSFHPKAKKRFELVVDGDKGTASMIRTEAVGTGVFGYSVDINGDHSFCPFSGVPRELAAFITAVRKGGPVPRALSATEAIVDLKVVEAICDAAAAKSAAGTRVAA